VAFAVRFPTGAFSNLLVVANGCVRTHQKFLTLSFLLLPKPTTQHHASRRRGGLSHLSPSTPRRRDRSSDRTMHHYRPHRKMSSAGGTLIGKAADRAAKVPTIILGGHRLFLYVYIDYERNMQ